MHDPVAPINTVSVDHRALVFPLGSRVIQVGRRAIDDHLGSRVAGEIVHPDMLEESINVEDSRDEDDLNRDGDDQPSPRTIRLMKQSIHNSTLP